MYLLGWTQNALDMGPYNHKILVWSKIGMGTFTSTVIFFYSNVPLVLISIIPSSFRSYQMLHHLDTPVWMEIFVGLTRILLFMLIIAWLSKNKTKELFRKEFWDRLGKVASIEMKRNWPHIFLAQLIVFLIFLYGLMNLLIQLIVGLSLVPLTGLLDIQDYDQESLRYSLVFFLKNMSVIPLSMVYILKMCGVREIR